MARRKLRRPPAKPWGGRFAESPHPLAEAFNASIAFDRRLARHDIQGSIAHARMLHKCRILTRAEADKIVAGLTEIAGEIARGEFRFEEGLEDIHMNIEHRLIAKIGEVGGKLHTARSRNDQVALDLRLFVREEIDALDGLIRRLQAALLDLAEAHRDAIMPGYTHLQRAQPVLFAHHLLAYFEMLQRDRDRLRDGRTRVNVLPLGAGGLAGTTFPIDRAFVARELGFPAVAPNSMDAVADRDFIVEFLAAAALVMMHLSRLGEEIVLWASAEFGFLELPDAFATGSSMMPQKKNPDIAELCRGKTGRVYGALFALLTLLKGLPLTYNKDLQEDKEPLFDAVDTTKASVEVLAAMVPALRVRPERMRRAAEEGFLNATDLADYLVTKGLPFRQAHEVAGRIVRRARERGKRLEDLPLKELRTFSPLFDRDVYPFIRLEACVERRQSAGGTAPINVFRALRAARRVLRS